jgi:hypothetical protein
MPNNDDINDWPALFISTYPPPPGFGNDNGTVRPVPGGVFYYLSPGIQPLTAFRPGAPFSCKIVVSNWGGGNSASMALAALWWSPALSGPTIPDKDKFLGFASVPVPPHGGSIATHDINADIPANAPPHICLLAKVWHALDPAPTTKIGDKLVEVADPVNDRHWSQHNLVTVKAAGSQKIQFLASNTMLEDAAYELLVQPVAREKWSVLAAGERATAVPARATFGLSGPHEERSSRGVNVIRHPLTLKAGERRRMTLGMELAEALHPGTFAAFEVQQLRFEKPVGGFCIVLRA